jgi:CRISPR-associated protein Cas2
MPQTLHLAAYDVRTPKRLRRALRTVKPYASGGQKSAYECWLSPSDINTLLAESGDVLLLDEDSFCLIPIDPRRGVIALGKAQPPSNPDFYYFG